MSASQPHYLLPAPTTHVLSEARATRLSPLALACLNELVDELLLRVVSQALTPSASSLASSSSFSSVSGGPLGPTDALTVASFKNAAIKILGPNLGKNATLEAELAVRELLKIGAPSLRGDPALKAVIAGPPGAAANELDRDQVAEVFGSVSAWIQLISALGAACPPSSAPLATSAHLATLLPPPRSPTNSNRATFVLALYVERTLTFVAERILHLVADVASRNSSSELADVAELEAALEEDDAVFEWYKNLTVRAVIASEGAKGASSPVEPPRDVLRASISARSSPALTRRLSEKGSSTPAAVVMRRASSDNGALGVTGFDELIQSGKTMRVSLTPDRLRTMESLGKNKSSPPGASPPLRTTVADSVPVITRKLVPRSPVSDVDEEEEDSEPDLFDGPPRRKKKQSLVDILSSAPPPDWHDSAVEELALNDVPADFSRSKPFSTSLSRASSTRSSLSPHAASPSMVRQLSADSAASSTFSTGSARRSVVSQGDANTVTSVRSNDERGDRGKEKKANLDVVDFLMQPTPSSRGGAMDTVSSSGSAKSKKGLRGFFGRDKKKEDEEPNKKRRDDDPPSLQATRQWVTAHQAAVSPQRDSVVSVPSPPPRRSPVAMATSLSVSPPKPQAQMRTPEKTLPIRSPTSSPALPPKNLLSIPPVSTPLTTDPVPTPSPRAAAVVPTPPPRSPTPPAAAVSRRSSLDSVKRSERSVSVYTTSDSRPPTRDKGDAPAPATLDFVPRALSPSSLSGRSPSSIKPVAAGVPDALAGAHDSETSNEGDLECKTSLHAERRSATPTLPVSDVGARSCLTPTVRIQADEVLRRLKSGVESATTVEECRALVELAFARLGLEARNIDTVTDDLSGDTPTSGEAEKDEEAANIRQAADDDMCEARLVGFLLGEWEEPATTLEGDDAAGGAADPKEDAIETADKTDEKENVPLGAQRVDRKKSTVSLGSAKESVRTPAMPGGFEGLATTDAVVTGP